MHAQRIDVHNYDRDIERIKVRIEKLLRQLPQSVATAELVIYQRVLRLTYGDSVLQQLEQIEHRLICIVKGYL